ncbi:MAG: GtrA family protein [Chromatiaceae bacterium]|nr:GtrA family protein [Chromatiaceae bacterium]
MIAEFLSRQFLMFLVTGGFAAAVNFASRILYNQWLGYSTSILAAYVTGMMTAFVLARRFVFKQSSMKTHQSALIFTLVNLVAVAQTWLVSVLLAYYLLPWMGFIRFVPEIAHGIGIAIPVFTSYLGHKYWSFR